MSDAMASDGALFTREDTVEAAWAVVDPVLDNHPLARCYQPCSWGPVQAESLIGGNGICHNPILVGDASA